MNGEKGCTPKEVGERAGSAGQRRAHTISTLILVSPLGLNSSFSFSRNARLLWSVSWRKKKGKSKSFQHLEHYVCRTVTPNSPMETTRLCSVG